MKSDIVIIDNAGNGFQEAVEQTKKVAEFGNISGLDAIQLQVLTEEMLSLARSITGEMAGTFWIDSEDKAFTLHLSTKTRMDAAKRFHLISASTENRNEAARSFIGYLRDRFENAMLSEDNSIFYDSCGMPLSGGSQNGEWDRFERSILRKLADEIRIGVRGGNVEMDVIKKF